jgi:hypothetical protein
LLWFIGIPLPIILILALFLHHKAFEHRSFVVAGKRREARDASLPCAAARMIQNFIPRIGAYSPPLSWI